MVKINIQQPTWLPTTTCMSLNNKLHRPSQQPNIGASTTSKQTPNHNPNQKTNPKHNQKKGNFAALQQQSKTK
ncbi:MAG TPA: hypothetical protein DGG95_00585 [Cytophagales bacterium]|nr:hypothetical protein [Cytophagales bacterium]